MSSYSLPILFVVPESNALPTTGTTSTLTAGQFGIYRDDATTGQPVAATAANAAAATWIQFFQGNHITIPFLNNKRSDRIPKTPTLLEWYKIPALTTLTPQITTVTGLEMKAGEVLNLTLRLFSNYIDNAYTNGLTRTVSVLADCLECGADPCLSAVTDETYEALADAINNDETLSQYITATVTGTVAGSDAALVLTTNTLVDPVTNTSDVHNDPFRQDRLSFYTYINAGTDVSNDFEVADRCDIAGVITVTQRGSYNHGMLAEVKQMEINYYSYSSVYKDLFVDPAYNGAFSSQATAASYDLYYLKFKMPEPMAWHSIEVMDEQVILAVPTGEATTIEAILTAGFGAPKNKAASAPVTFSPLAP